jgi:4-hydroxy-3-methylbut-2-enyl diphosphate reductase
MGKRVLIAAPRGYCAGVDRAIVTVEKALELYGAPLYVRKEIVHNKHVVATLEQRGVIFVNETDEVPEGKTVVFSAHGVSPAVHADAAARGLKTIDATCPLVTKVHNEVKRFATEDTEILLIGHAGHEEVEGTAGEAPGKVIVVDGLDGARNVQPTPGKNLIWLTQTTLSVDETMQSVEILRERFPDIASPPSDDICYATQNRQEAIRAIAAQSDLVLVVGSTNSSNSVRLVEVALEYGAKAAYLVDYADEAKDEWLTGVETIGVTSGASVPEILVTDLLKWLEYHGFHDQQEVEAKKESLTFALPQELRSELKSASK